MRYGVPFQEIGRVTGEMLTIDGVCELPVEALAESHASALDDIIG